MRWTIIRITKSTFSFLVLSSIAVPVSIPIPVSITILVSIVPYFLYYFFIFVWPEGIILIYNLNIGLKTKNYSAKWK